jgi:hypothetical protein
MICGARNRNVQPEIRLAASGETSIYVTLALDAGKNLAEGETRTEEQKSNRKHGRHGDIMMSIEP